ncbi:tRNA-splicing ligase RtcB/release factor H-coupled RctB family protein [Filimonas lacunae]|uniref:3'-phosphate/5'-hydroxy nucleic acid ligase n=1 Tax=Filimonas lacunae TaxID=477680 RepID=A0A173MR44_9BACT|nr:RtcB family protein [Filimonas lacunae]BAV09808.1 RNA-2',3'-PO4:RNA-5'-OH ligase [Filimonas lacunae]SIS79249.1 tRNA-splicing ligase RtcB/release factor H-coupled RctB family protein [Filimonas lacunae]
MSSIDFYCNANSIEQNALSQLQQYAQKPFVEKICAFTDIHYCTEKALPVGVAFTTSQYCYPLITGKDIGCGVMYLKTEKSWWLKPFNKSTHYQALQFAHTQMTDDGLGGGNHFLSIEEDENAVYIICHTGTRNRGIALYQQCLQLTRDFSREYGQEVDFVHRDFLTPTFTKYYEETLEFGYDRRKAFCLKTLQFLQNANYIRCNKAGINKQYLQNNSNSFAEQDECNGTPYILEDSIHNHIRFNQTGIWHRKGSTELSVNKTVVIPLSMSRGSLLVKATSEQAAARALYSCAHGAGRRLSRFDAMKYWSSTLKEKERRAYKARFSELLNKSGQFSQGYVQEFDFAYKSDAVIFQYQPYLKKVTQTSPVVTIKYTEI